MYKVIDIEKWSRKKQYLWFSTFSNPDYGFNIDVDVTNVVNYSKETKTSFTMPIGEQQEQVILYSHKHC